MFLKIVLFFFLSLGLIFPTFQKANHAFYISLIEIEHTDNKPTSTVLVKVFTNDFQDAINHAYKKEKLVFQEPFYDKNSRWIQDYFSKRLEFEVNRKPQKLLFSTGKKVGDQYQLVFDLTCPKEWKMVEIDANFLMEILPLQQNIINLSEKGQKYFGRVKKEKTKIHFSFD